MKRPPMRSLALLAATLSVIIPATRSAQAGSTSIPAVSNPGLLKTLTGGQTAAIARNGFVVSSLPGGDFNRQQFYDLYTHNLNAGIPSFITTDAALHTFHIMYDKTLMAMERELLAPKLQKLSAGIAGAAAYQYGATGNSRIKAAARLNLGYASVAQKLLNPSTRLPALVASPAKRELALIQAHRGFAMSPLFGYQIDYSQFAPRGHYNNGVTLRRYFQAMMWYARPAFLLNGEGAPQQTRQALLLVRAVTLTPGLYRLWSAIFDPATAWVGHADDLSIRDYTAVMLRVFGKNAPVSALASDSRISQFIKQANALPSPQLSSDPSGALATKGMRFFPQRFIPDAAIMQSLIWNKVGTPQRKRLWPMGLDVAAALGSQQARALLSGPLHQNAYAHYTQRLSSLQRYFTSRPAKVWQQNLYWRWLDTLRAVWGPRSAGSPAFTGTVAWKTKNLATGLGSWAELRHDTLLYAKQPYGLGAGGAAPPFRTPYVEPVPQVWARLLALTRAFKATLSAEGLLDSLRQSPFRLGPDQTKFLYPRPPKGEQGYRAAIDSFAALVALLQRTSQAELQGKQVPHADAVTLENFGPELDMIDNFFQDNGAGKTEMPEQKQVAIIADIFTEPNSGKVLEEGVGDVQRLFAVVSINGKRWLAEGGVYSYYEFHQPMSNRLTDEAWRAMRNRPPQPSWTAAYITR